MLVVIAIVLVVVVVVAAVLTSVRGRRRRERLWQDLAARFGFEARTRRDGGVTGTHQGFDVVIGTTVRRNKGAFLELRMRRPGAGPEVAVERRNLVGNRGATDATGDAGFDRIFAVSGAPTALDADQRSRLVAAAGVSESLAGTPILSGDGFAVFLDWTRTRDLDATADWVGEMLRTGAELLR